jgi:hypothetical protein
VGSQAGNDGVDVLDGECDVADTGVFAGACRLSPWFDGEWNFVSSSRPLPAGVCMIAMSARTPSSPTTRPTQRPSTGPSPYSTSPRSTKNSVAAARSSTTMPTCSIRRIAMCSIVQDSGRGARRWEETSRPHLDSRSSDTPALYARALGDGGRIAKAARKSGRTHGG